MDGFEVIENLHKRDKCKDIPVILLTSDNDRDTEVKGFKLGASDFISKPYVTEIMLQRIERILQFNLLQKHLQKEVDKQTRTAELHSEKLERLSIQLVQTLVGTIDAKDKYTNGHSVRVAEYAKEILKRNRSYRRALPQEIVKQEFIKGIGTQFDPVYAKIMISIMEEDLEYLLREIV